jgi:sugar/nucleoside kinase (ribokinase family)
MEALFIGQTYIDIVFLTDEIPTGDNKAVAKDYAVSFGGNAVTAGFCSARLGVKPDMLCSLADDWLGRMFIDMASRYGISIHARKVRESSLSLVMPVDGKRAILRCRDDAYLHPFPVLDLEGCRGLHLDGHQPDAALHYAKACRAKGILTSLDGGGVRSNTEELLEYIDVAVVSERMCEQMNLSAPDMLSYLKTKECRVGGVTQGERGIIWYDKTVSKGAVQHHDAIPILPELVIDTNGAGDVFHGAYMFSYLTKPEAGFDHHFRFARSASAHKVQHLGNDAGMPTLADVMKTFQ